jgi:hypothetical protein
MENYLGGSSKALQFVIDALKHARDKCLPDAPGQVERNKFRPTFLLHHAFNRSLWRLDSRITANLATAI